MTRANVLGLFRLFRVDLSFAAGVCVVLGQLLAHGTFPSTTTILLGFFSYFFISATALILNDYFDYETDKINAPERPLPSGLVTKPQVLTLSVVVALLGLVLSLLISVTAFLIAFIVWSLGFLYNWKLKRAGIWGNLLVSLSVASTFIFGGATVGNFYEPLVLWYALLVFLFNLGEEIAADASDVQGDLKAGSRSLAIVYGQHTALRISAAIFLSVIVVSAVPFLLRWLSWPHFFPIAIMDGVIIYSTYRLLNQNTVDRRKYIRIIYLTGLGSLIGFILIRTIFA